MSKLQAAYLAGIIDGEGYIGILKSKKGNKKYWSSSRDYIYIPVLKVCMTDKDLIFWLKNSYGGCVEIRKQHNNSKESYCWTCRKKIVIDILQKIYPYLRVKRKQAEVIFKYKNLNNGTGNPVDDTNWGKRDELYDLLRSLNKRGVA
jgi:hypothetical protein